MRLIGPAAQFVKAAASAVPAALPAASKAATPAPPRRPPSRDPFYSQSSSRRWIPRRPWWWPR
jgi:hypothetical protein